jgi:hypothetical protein
MQHAVRSQESTANGLRAAQYLRVSTDQQKYAIENQAAALAAYAARRNIQIVSTYSDQGRSGVRITGRDGLQKLIEDVQRGRTRFDCILVYDVIDTTIREVADHVLVAMEEHRADVTFLPELYLLTINRSFTVGIAVARSVANGTGAGPSRRWELRKLKYRRSDLTLIVRMDSSNARVKNYYLVPTTNLPRRGDNRIRISDRYFGKFGYDGLGAVLKAIADRLTPPRSPTRVVNREA